MVKNIKGISDFIELVAAYNEIRDSFSPDAGVDLAEKVLMFSDPIVGFENKAAAEHIQTYSLAAVRLTEELKRGKADPKKLSEWCAAAKRAVTAFFLLLSGDSRYPLIEDGEDEDLLLDFFAGGDFYSTAAYYIAVKRFARRDPKFCYEETLQIFERQPDLVCALYNELSYLYNPAVIKDEYFDVCPICGHKESEPYFCADQALANDSRFAPAKLWMKCGGCHNLYAYNFPLQITGEVNGHYTAASSSKQLTPRHILWTYSDIFNNIKQFNDGRKYLEIGTGTGEMLAVALEMGYDVSAVEICKEDCANISGALGVDVVWSDFMRFETDKRFDVIIMGDVLEHVSRPIEALKKACSLLNDKGVLWLSTPNFDSGFTRMRKFSDPMWNQKNHFTYFSFDGLKPFLDEAGLELRRYDASSRYNGSMELILQKK